MILAPLLAPRASWAQGSPAAPTPPVPSASPSPPPDAPPPFAQPAPAPATAPPPDAPTPSEPPAGAAPAPAPTPPSTPPSSGSAAFEPLPAPSSSAPNPVAAPIRARATATSEPAPATAPGASGSSYRSAASTPESSDDSHDSNGVFGPFRIGVLLGSGLPDLLSLGGTIKVTRYFGAGINVGLIPTVKLSFYGDATLSFQEYDAYGHIFPFGGAFFLGAGVGYATVKGTVANSFDLSAYNNQNAQIPKTLPFSSQASVRTLVLTPQLGLLHTFASGFTLGADVGAQVPIAPSQVDFTTQLPTFPEPYKTQIQKNYIDPNDAKVRSTLDKIGRTPIPTIGVKIGWLL